MSASVKAGHYIEKFEATPSLFFGIKTDWYTENLTDQLRSREKLDSDGHGYFPGPGINYSEYQLFSLRTRLEHDPAVARFITEEKCSITFQNRSDLDKNYVYLTLAGYDKEEGPELKGWFTERVKYHLKNHPQYCGLISQWYPLIVEGNRLPAWWVERILPLIDLTILFPKTDSEANGSDIPGGAGPEGYHAFYSDGVVYLNLIRPRVSTEGRWSEPAGSEIKYRTSVRYGDYSSYPKVYQKVYGRLINYLTLLYQYGAYPLVPGNSLIDRWQLSPVYGSGGELDLNRDQQERLYLPLWKDIRISSFDGVVGLLERQENIKRWDHRLVFFRVIDDPLVSHYLARWSQGIIYQGYFVYPVSSYSEAVKLADVLEKEADYAEGTVIKTATTLETPIEDDKLNTRYFDYGLGSWVNSQMVVKTSN